ncbi:MAG: DUF4157 domain-containing protein [Methylococcaceae bacterium]
MTEAKVKSIEKTQKAPEAVSHARHPGAAVSQTGFDAGLVPQMAGNLAVQQLFRAGAIQAKLSISQPGDSDEQEADRVADHVMRMADPGSISSTHGVIHRKCAACEAGGATCPKCEEEEKVKRKENSSHMPHASTAVHSQIAALRGGGQPLAPSVRAFFEPRFGRDFSGVRVHTDGLATESARAIQAKAFTTGQDIAFGTGQFAPGSSEGRKLLAHELTHTIQQGATNILPTASTPHRTAADLLITAQDQRFNSSVVQSMKIMESDPISSEDQKLQAHELTDTLQQGGVVSPFSKANDLDGSANAKHAEFHRPFQIQRQETTDEAPLIDRYRKALSEVNWDLAALLLNGFNDVDIQTRVNDSMELPPASRLQLRLHTPDWAFRVRRPLLILDYQDAKAAGRWADAAVLLNGFSDTDIQLLASQLTADEVGPMAQGARDAMTGVSLNRVLMGIAHRYDAVSAEPLGTKVVTVVGLMQAADLSMQLAKAYVQLKLGVGVAADPAGAASPGGQPKPGDFSADIQAFSAAMKGGGLAMAAGAATTPKGQMPEYVDKGTLAHMLIGDTYCTLNPPSVYDLSVFDILSFSKGRISGLAKAIKAATRDLFTNFDMRPDIVDLGKLQIFEIKPIRSTALAVAEAKLYVELFDSLGLKDISFSLGNSGNPGTFGMIPGPEEVLVWASPLPGAIVYAFVKPPENPRRVQERIQNGAYEPGLGLGPQAAIALSVGVAGAAALAVAGGVEVSAAAMASYEVMLPILAVAAQTAGQAIPKLVEGK